jgi:hypothetical protein
VNSGLLQYVFARNANDELIYYQRFSTDRAWGAGNATRGLDHNLWQIAGELHAVADANSWGVHVFWRNANNELIHYWTLEAPNSEGAAGRSPPLRRPTSLRTAHISQSAVVPPGSPQAGGIIERKAMRSDCISPTQDSMALSRCWYLNLVS